MRGLIKATHYYATMQARADWKQLAAYATANGYAADVLRLMPADGAGHKTIDTRINALMRIMGIDGPFWQLAAAISPATGEGE